MNKTTYRRRTDTMRLLGLFILVWTALSIGLATRAKAEYLGRIGGNPFCSDCTSNPFAPIVNPFNPKSLTNEFGPYGNPLSPYSPYNEFATDTPEVYGTADE